MGTGFLLLDNEVSGKLMMLSRLVLFAVGVVDRAASRLDLMGNLALMEEMRLPGAASTRLYEI